MTTIPIPGIKGFKVLQPTKLVEDVVAYIEKRLPLFSASAEFIDITGLKKNENQHSTAFCAYMTNGCASKFYFNRESSQKGSSTIDIGVYKGSKQIFTIEAKVLPTPLSGAKDKRSEHEYVHGRGAGIQRFKEGNHGLDDLNNALPENGMIAYIKENDFEFWLEKVNGWINDVSWPTSEILKHVYSNVTAKLISEHTRDDKSLLKLHHFWVKV